MLIESLAQKTRLAMVTVLATIGGCAVICGFTVWCCISLVNKEREQIYILDGDIPFLAERAQRKPRQKGVDLFVFQNFEKGGNVFFFEAAQNQSLGNKFRRVQTIFSEKAPLLLRHLSFEGVIS